MQSSRRSPARPPSRTRRVKASCSYYRRESEHHHTIQT
jgi:hypothetical protein